jgi:hypothetical protein
VTGTGDFTKINVQVRVVTGWGPFKSELIPHNRPAIRVVSWTRTERTETVSVVIPCCFYCSLYRRQRSYFV